ncbi:hypothetical protein [Shewanella sedimentimangrovi]|uniref:Uncharacterized protein n=1 Tax=Shewanella sedimentimangrovi TaxID=2814293 RepID=A0ABX7R1D7_9GAMM|nr:hypothetical protein [Shewanella sedimentimangrovi]QSX37619.1 hypothetical protein JYB85_01925 [Shewanella sedimentimangrovi]
MSVHSYVSYYQSFEKDIENLARYIEICEDNYCVYSVELTRLYLSICSEVDVTLKALCGILGDNKSNNITGYVKTIKLHCPELIDKEVSLTGYQLICAPWSELHCGKNPGWWSEHNKVKHDRMTNYKKANLRNVLMAFSALYTINVFIIFKEKCKQDPMFKFEFANVLTETMGFFKLARIKDVPFAYLFSY